VLLLALFCTATAGAEFSGYGCSDGLCQAKVKSGDKTIGLMWGAYVAPTEEFLVATEGNNAGTYYSLLNSDPGQLTVGVIAERVVPPKDTLVRRDQGVISVVRGADGLYSFVPHELVGMGRVVLEVSPDQPGMFRVVVRLNP
jgi:hypothetical protein